MENGMKNHALLVENHYQEGATRTTYQAEKECDCLVKDFCKRVGHIQKIWNTYQRIAGHHTKRRIDGIAILESYE
ncbi:hypothetical protein G9A89_012183 [Geosiphon pyriformis]|nr:hypothetical protein G9A89_012183 [Geosiphon pyriformis]